MSKAKHTPGPWVFDDHCRVYSQLGKVVVANTGPIARSPHSLDECRANTALIAAAPDLLEALNVFIEFGAKNAPVIQSMPMFMNAWELAKRAIARAEGGE